MTLKENLMVEGNFRTIGFAGGKGKNYLLDKLSFDLARQGKRIVISHIEEKIFPATGHIVFKPNESDLLRKIESELKEHSIIYAGRALDDNFLEGIRQSTVKKIMASDVVDHIMLIFGEEEVSLLTKTEVDNLLKIKYLHELVYCLQLDHIDQKLNSEVVSDISEFLKRFPKYHKDKIYSHQLIVDYISDENNGICKLFKQRFPTLLVFTDISNLLLENRAINIGRDLYQRKFNLIFQANLQDNIVKKVSTR